MRTQGVMPIRLVLASREPILLYGLEKLFEPQEDVQVTAVCHAPSQLPSLVGPAAAQRAGEAAAAGRR